MFCWKVRCGPILQKGNYKSSLSRALCTACKRKYAHVLQKLLKTDTLTLHLNVVLQILVELGQATWDFFYVAANFLHQRVSSQKVLEKAPKLDWGDCQEFFFLGGGGGGKASCAPWLSVDSADLEEHPQNWTGIYYCTNFLNYWRSWNTFTTLSLGTWKYSIRDGEQGFVLIRTNSGFLQFLHVQTVHVKLFLTLRT